MPDFESFWFLWPKCRRVAKPKARIMWDRLTPEEQVLALEALPKHVKLWEAEGREATYIPHAASWLNPKEGRRWEDEIELPQPKTVIAWWATEAGTIAMAAQVGVQTRPGEGFAELKQRIIAATRRVG